MSLSTIGKTIEVDIHTALDENGYTGKMHCSKHNNLHLATDVFFLLSIVVIIAEHYGT